MSLKKFQVIWQTYFAYSDAYCLSRKIFVRL